MKYLVIIMGMLISIPDRVLTLSGQNEVKTLLPVNKEKKWGFINMKGEIIVPLTYDKAELSQHGIAVAQTKNEFHLLDSNGITLQIIIAEEVRILDEHCFAYRTSQGWALTQITHDVPFLNNADDIRVMDKNMYRVKKNKKLGVYNLQYGWLLQPEYDMVKITDVGNLVVGYKNNFLSFFNSKGKILLQDSISGYRIENNFIIYRKNGKQGIYNYNEEANILPPVYDQISLLDQSFFRLVKNEKVTCYSIHKKKFIGGEYQEFSRFNELYVMINTTGGIGLLNRDGKIVAEPVYEFIAQDDKVLIVIQNGKYGLIRDEKLVCSPQYDYITTFFSHLALVRNADKWGIINDKGICNVIPEYSKIDLYVNTAKCYNDENITLAEFDTSGNFNEKTHYTNVKSIKIGGGYNRHEDQLSISSDNAQEGNWYFDPAKKLWGMKDNYGKIVLEPVYSKVEKTGDIGFSIVAKSLTDTLWWNCFGIKIPVTEQWGIIKDETRQELIRSNKAYAFFDKNKLASHSIGFDMEGTMVFFKGESYNYTELTWIGDIRENYYPLVRKGSVKITPIDSSKHPLETLHHWYYRQPSYVQELCYDYLHAYIMDTSYVLDMQDGNIACFTDVKADFKTIKYYEDIQKKNFEGLLIKENGKWGILNSELDKKIYNSFDYLDCYKINEKKETFPLIAGRKIENFGIVDKSSNIIIPSFTNSSFSYFGNYIFAHNHDKNELTIIEGQDTLFQKSALEYKLPVDGYFPLKINDVWFYYDLNGNKILEDSFSQAEPFIHGVALVSNFGKRYLIDVKGNQQLKEKAEHLQHFHYPFIITKNKSGVGILDLDGNWIIQPEYDKIEWNDSSDLIIVRKNDKYGIFHRNGQIVQKPVWDKLFHFKNSNSTIGEKGNSTYILTSSGKSIKLDNDLKPGKFENGFVAIKQGREKIIMNESGEKLFSIKAKRIRHIGKNIFLAFEKDSFSMVSNTGEIIYKTKDTLVYDFDESETCIWKGNDGYYYVNTRGELMFHTTYQKAESFRNNMACVMINNKWGLIDRQGKWILEPSYSSLKILGDNQFEFSYPFSLKIIVYGKAENKYSENYVFDEMGYDAHGNVWMKKGEKIAWSNNKGNLIWDLY